MLSLKAVPSRHCEERQRRGNPLVIRERLPRFARSDRKLPSAMAISLFLLLSTICPLQASEGWESNLVVSSGVAQNRLSFGQRPDASDGLDGRYDAAAMLGGDVRASFAGSNKPLWRDIKRDDGQKSWLVNVESSLRQNISLAWDASRFPDDSSIALLDKATGASIDMTSRSVYTYSNAGPREFLIEFVSQEGVANIEDETEAITYLGGEEGRDIYGRIILAGSSALPVSTIEFDSDREDAEDSPSDADSDVPEDNSAITAIEDEADEILFVADCSAGSKKCLLASPSKLSGRLLEEKKRIKLSWKDDSIGAHGFIIDSKEKEEWVTVAVTWNYGASFEHKRACTAKDSVCFYRVKAFNYSGESDYSNVLSFELTQGQSRSTTLSASVNWDSPIASKGMKAVKKTGNETVVLVTTKMEGNNSK